MNSIMPHHCGKHSNCTAAHCKDRSIELSERMMHRLSSENDELTSDVKLKTNERCSKVSRFKGEIMDISVKGQQMFQKVTSSRFFC